MASFCEIAVTRYLDSMQVSCIALPLLGPQPLAALELCPTRLFCVEGLSSLLLKLVCFLRIQVGVWGCKWREWKINVRKVTCCRKKSAIMVITVQFKIWNVWVRAFSIVGKQSGCWGILSKNELCVSVGLTLIAEACFYYGAEFVQCTTKIFGTLPSRWVVQKFFVLCALTRYRSQVQNFLPFLNCPAWTCRSWALGR